MSSASKSNNNERCQIIKEHKVPNRLKPDRSNLGREKKERTSRRQTSQGSKEVTNRSQKRGIKGSPTQRQDISREEAGGRSLTHYGTMGDKEEVAPIYSQKGERKLDSPAVQSARRNLSPDVREVFDFFVDILSRSEIRSFEHELTSAQKAECTLVTDMIDWDLVSDDFENEVNTYKFLTFDLEKFMPSPTTGRIPKIQKGPHERTRVMYAHFATITGKTVIFDLEALGGEPVPHNDPLESLPPEFRSWIASQEILVVGSSVRDDVLDANWQGNKLVNTIEVFQKAMAPQGNDPPLVDIGSRSKPGLGAQSFYAKSFNFKPMKRAEFEKLYGEHQYVDQNGYKRWPRCRNKFFLYKWPKQEGRLIKECIYYMYHDATTPVALVARLFVDRCIAGNDDENDVSIVSATRNTLDARYGHVEAADTLQVSAPDDLEDWDDWEDSSISVTGSNNTILLSSSSSNKTIEISSSSQDDEGAQPKRARREEREEGEVSGDESPTSSVTSSAEKILRSGKPKPGSYFGFFGADQDRQNPYQLDPAFGRRCTYCGIGGHSYKTKEGAILCEKYLGDDPNAQKCAYSQCGDPTKHRTEACPTLHHRCGICHHRGHYEADGCWNWSEEGWEAARDAFEEVADRGCLTTRRRHDERWGFFCHIWREPFPYFAKYVHLLRMPVREVDIELGLAPDNRARRVARSGEVTFHAGTPRSAAGRGRAPRGRGRAPRGRGRGSFGNDRGRKRKWQ